MTETQFAKPEMTISSLVDTAAKIVAILIAASLLVGITYNIAFFLGTKPQWLFHISVADNVTATLFSLPLSALLMVIAGLAATSKWVQSRKYGRAPFRRQL